MKQTVKTSRAAGQLEKMFRELNKHYFGGQLPEPIISLKKTPSAYGHITCSKVWQAGGENKYEINISSATLDRPIEETAATLLHEMYERVTPSISTTSAVLHAAQKTCWRSWSAYRPRVCIWSATKRILTPERLPEN